MQNHCYLQDQAPERETAAGLTIIFTQPFHVGDYISINKGEGEVLDISLSSTTLGHADRSMVVIPNRKIVGEILHNYGRIRQLNLTVGVSDATDMNVALSAIDKILRANPRVLRTRRRESPSRGSRTPASSSASIRGSMCPTTSRPWVRSTK